MKKIIAIISACLSLITSQANQITGIIDFDGNVTYNGPLATTTGISIISGVFVSGATEDFYPETGFSPVHFTPFIFTSIASTPIELWSFTHNGKSFSFTLNDCTPLYANHSLTISGNGVITATGYEPTPGFWTLSSSGIFRFTSEVLSNPNIVPDGATTAILLGTSLFAMSIIRRKSHSH